MSDWRTVPEFPGDRDTDPCTPEEDFDDNYGETTAARMGLQ